MIKILHLGHSRKWRGGENQVKLLVQGMNDQFQDIHNHIGYPAGAQMIGKLASSVEGVLTLASKRPFDPRSTVALINYVNKNRIDILAAHSGNSHSLAYYASHFLPQVRINVHRHVDFPIKNQYLTRRKYLSQRINQFVAVSSAIKTRLLDYGISESKISVIKSIIDASAYTNPDKSWAKKNYCRRYGLDCSLPLLGFAGALEEKKDPTLFINTIKQLEQKGISVNALIAGSGPLDTRLAQQIDQLQLTETIKLVGFINDMPNYFAALDIFVLPSRQEGLGTVLLEAIHSQCVAIASNVGGINEIIINQQTGVLATAGNVDSFVNAVEMILAKPDLSKLIIQNAIKHVEIYFDSKNMIEANYRNFKKLIKQPARKPG